MTDQYPELEVVLDGLSVIEGMRSKHIETISQGKDSMNTTTEQEEGVIGIHRNIL